MSNLFAHSARSLFPYPLNFNTWAIFCSLGLFAGVSCIFPIAYANAANAWAITLFYPLSGGLFPPSLWFIFEGWFGVSLKVDLEMNDLEIDYFLDYYYYHYHHHHQVTLQVSYYSL